MIGMQTSRTPTRETSPLLSPDHSMRRDRLSTSLPSGSIAHRHEMVTSPFHELANPPRRCSGMILPLAVGLGAGAYSIYKVYSKMKAPIPPKRNMTMSVTRNRY